MEYDEPLKWLLQKLDPDHNLDIGHDAWVELESQHPGNVSPSAWIQRTKQRACDEHRRRKRHSLMPISELQTDDRQNGPDHLAENREMKKTVRRCISDLPTQYRIVMECFLESFTPTEICRRLKCPLQTVYTRRRRAMQLLAGDPRMRALHYDTSHCRQSIESQ